MVPRFHVQAKLQQVGAANPNPSPALFPRGIPVSIPTLWEWGFVGNGVRPGVSPGADPPAHPLPNSTSDLQMLCWPRVALSSRLRPELCSRSEPSSPYRDKGKENVRKWHWSKEKAAPGFLGFKLAFQSWNGCSIPGTGRSLQVLISIKNCSINDRSLSCSFAGGSGALSHQRAELFPIQTHLRCPREPPQSTGSRRCWRKYLARLHPWVGVRTGEFLMDAVGLKEWRLSGAEEILSGVLGMWKILLWVFSRSRSQCRAVDS